MNGLRYAVSKADILQLNELIDSGASVNDPIVIEDDQSHTVREETPLIIASRLGHAKIVRTLLMSGADVNASILGTGMTALHWACVRGHVDTVKLLLLNGANINQLDYLYESPLLEAIWSTRLEIVKMLVTCGADMEKHVNSGHDSSILFAFHTRQKEIGRFLLAAGADVGKTNNFGEDILWAMPEITTNFELMVDLYDFLIEAGCQPKQKHLKQLENGFGLESPHWSRIYHKLVTTMSNARTLSVLCRIAVRKKMLMANKGQCIISKSYALPLPYPLQKYVAMGEEIDMYCLK